MMYNSPENASCQHHHLSTTTTSSATAPRNNLIIPYSAVGHYNHHPIMIPLPPHPVPPPFSGGSDGADEFPVRDERFPQWSYQETRDFIEIRAQLEWEFTPSKGKRSLWEVAVSRMREKGYSRTIDQCKSKWKNLVNRYKGQEASDLESGRQCPFFYELHALFTARDNRLRLPQVDSDTAPIKGKKRLQNSSGYQSHEEYSEEQENEDETNVDQAGKGTVALEGKAGRGKRQKKGKSDKHMIPSPGNVDNNDCILGSIREMLRNFIQQQQRIDMQWRESMEKHSQERELFEQEWRQTMEKLEREKMMMEQAWREREEQRKLREESRAEKRDALLNMLLNKLIDEENP